MEEYEGYIDAPTEPYFVASRPAGGYKLVYAGDMIPASSIFPTTSSFMVEAESKDGTWNRKAPNGYRSRLLLPIGDSYERKNLFSTGEYSEGAFFQRFANLQSDEEILVFANGYGYLSEPPFIKGEGCKGCLESLDLWKKEIKIINIVLQILADCEDRKPLRKYFTRLEYSNEEKVIHFPINVIEEWGWGKTCRIKYIAIESEMETVRRCLAAFLDKRLDELGVSLKHFLKEDGAFESCLMPKTLLGAIWLNLSQSFFRDGNTDMIFRRCFLTGNYYPEKELSIRRKGKNKGRYYHPDNKQKFYTQQNNIKKAEAEGRTIKPDRKGKTKFIVDEI